MHGIAAPQPGERTIVTIDVAASHALSIPGEVVYIEHGIGFGVAFHDLSPTVETQLRQLVASFIKESA